LSKKLNKKKFGKSSAIASSHAFNLLEENILPSTDGKALHSSISHATDHIIIRESISPPSSGIVSGSAASRSVVKTMH